MAVAVNQQSAIAPVISFLLDDSSDETYSILPVDYDVSTEQVQQTTLFSTADVDSDVPARNLIPTNNVTALSSFNGNTYFVWVDSDFRPRITKISSNGVSTQYLDSDDTYLVQDDGHHTFSIGIDKQGYIHVAGDMHNFEPSGLYLDKFSTAEMMYWVSSSPEDIDSFDFVGNNSNRSVPGDRFTYCKFYTDRNNELFMLARINLTDGFFPGVRAIGLYAYDSISKTWTAKGGFAPSNTIPEQYQSIFWEDNGHSGGGYQGYMATMMFDLRNRMHLGWTANNDNSVIDATHVLYAYSDDSGETFHKASGAQIKGLPMRASGQNGADVVSEIQDDTEYYWVFAGVFVDGQGSPAVSYWKSSDGTVPARVQHWNASEGQWSASYNSLTTGTAMLQNLNDHNGVISYVSQGRFGSIKRGLSHEDDLSETTIDCSISSVDRSALRYDGAHIFVCEQSSGHLSIEKVVFNKRGSFTQEVWQDITGSSLTSLKQSSRFPNYPSSREALDGNFELLENNEQYFGTRLRAMLYPPESGKYTFYVAGNEHAELWLSKDATMDNATKIAYTSTATAFRGWTVHSSQKSVEISLENNKPYYIEVVHKGNDVNDHVSVAWEGPSLETGINMIESDFLSPWAGIPEGVF